MLFFGVFLQESAHTAAKSRTNLSTNSGKATKRLGRLAHMCKFVWEWIYAKQIAPRDTRGHLGGFRGSTIQKSGKAVRLAPTLVHVCGFIWEWTWAKYKSPFNSPGAFGGRGLWCHKFNSPGKLSNGWTDWHQIWHTSADPSGNGYTPNKLPLETQGGHLGVLGVKHSKVLGSCQTAAPIGTKFGKRLRIRLGMDIG